MQFNIPSESCLTKAKEDLYLHINTLHMYLSDNVDKVLYVDMLDVVTEAYYKLLSVIAYDNRLPISNLTSLLVSSLNNNYTNSNFNMFLMELLDMLVLGTTDSKQTFSKYKFMYTPQLFKDLESKEGLNTRININITDKNLALARNVLWYKELETIIRVLGIKETINIITLLAGFRVKKEC